MQKGLSGSWYETKPVSVYSLHSIDYYISNMGECRVSVKWIRHFQNMTD